MPEAVESPAPVSTTTRRAWRHASASARGVLIHDYRTLADALTPPARPRARRSSRPTPRPPAAALGGRVGEALDQRARGQHLVDAPPLHAATAAVDQSDLAEARLHGRFQVGLHDRRDLARGKGVQVERFLDRDDDGTAHASSQVTSPASGAGAAAGTPTDGATCCPP